MKLNPKQLIFLLLLASACAQTPNEKLFSASYSGDVGIVRTAINEGANINARSEFDDSDTPLLNSVSNGHIALAKFLIQHGAKLEIDVDGCKAVLMNVQGPKNVELRKFSEDACRKERAGSGKD